MTSVADGVRSRDRTRYDKAHAQAIRVDFTEIVKFLSESLGPKLTAFIAGVDTKTVHRWINSDGQRPREAYEQRLRAAFQIFQLLQAVESPPTVRAWFMGMNPQLDDASPAEALAEDRKRDVMAAARAFVQGG
ncbi:hypothetical protein CLV47_11826 [Antricoccus suffuscus]|uniref:Uncharacterized protein n=1 Tax=Antricoccus suffuscus TaxID=1629062 RepID=A0A2T0ZTI1_9ACTN|nr:hypothetical protein [Antricoccus suffuscus]PRZ39662.1 hypothetical protein CLV47_11826 [Antricoccus suffuscus]